MRWNFRPSKPQAVFGAFVGAGMLVVGITTANKNVPFLIFWCAVVVGITAMDLWAAFAKDLLSPELLDQGSDSTAA